MVIIMTIEEFIKSLNFEENDYFYHVTGSGNGETISEEGLYVDGNNILDTDNILETTTLPLTPDIASSVEQLKQYLSEELSDAGLRDTSEFVVLGAPKECMKQIVSDFCDFKDGTYYEGVIPSEYIMGYFSRNSLDFIANENFGFGTDEFFESMTFKSF